MKKLIVLAVVVFTLVSFAVKSARNFAADLHDQRRAVVAEIR